MPEHFAVNTNIQVGTVAFNNTKVMAVIFNKEFEVVPSVTLTLSDENNTPPYKYQVTKNGLKIKFKQPYSGNVDWLAIGGIG